MAQPLQNKLGGRELNLVGEWRNVESRKSAKPVLEGASPGKGWSGVPGGWVVGEVRGYPGSEGTVLANLAKGIQVGETCEGSKEREYAVILDPPFSPIFKSLFIFGK